MSNLRHRQPAWRWSVVLLSTALLLSPAAARALLCALTAQQAGIIAAASHAKPAEPRQAPSPGIDPAQAPRRSEEEAAALRAAGLADEEFDDSRLDPSDPSAPAASDAAIPSPTTVVFLVPSRADVLVSDDGPAVSPAFAPAPPGPSPRREAARSLPPRAPPASV